MTHLSADTAWLQLLMPHINSRTYLTPVATCSSCHLLCKYTATICPIILSLPALSSLSNNFTFYTGKLIETGTYRTSLLIAKLTTDIETNAIFITGNLSFYKCLDQLPIFLRTLYPTTMIHSRYRHLLCIN